MIFISIFLVNMSLVNSTYQSAFALEPTNYSVVSPNQNGNVTVDGTISEEEYQYHYEFQGGYYTLFWSTTSDEIFIGIKGETVGWVALGIDPETRMQGADMIFGWVNESGQANLRDAMATGPTGPHPEDTDSAIGGDNNISEFNGTQDSTVTMIEFKRNLTSTDTKGDKTIPSEDSVNILWAVGSSDDWDAIHNYKGKAEINFKDGTVLEFSSFLEPAEVFGLATLAAFFFLLVLGVISVSVLFSKKSSVRAASATPRLDMLVRGKSVERRLLNRTNIGIFFVLFLIWLVLMWWTLENGRIILSLIRSIFSR